MSAFIAKTLDDALKRREPSKVAPFRLITVRGPKLRPGVNLDRTRELELMEDKVLFRRIGPDS